MRVSIGFLLMALVVLAFSARPAYSLDTSSVVGVWLFDKDGDASDISGNGHDGEADGDVKWVKGKFGSAIELDGTNAVVVDHDDDLSLETYTLVAWVNIPKPPTDWWTIVAKDGWPNRNYGIWLASGTGLAHNSFTSGAAPNNNTVNAVSPVEPGDWYHVTGTYDLKAVKLYINGEFDVEAPYSDKPNTTDVPVIMGRTPTGTYRYEGMIDEVAIFDTALSEDDIKAIMTKGLESATAVSPKARLASTWGDIKLQ